jgi:hypothetical protein
VQPVDTKVSTSIFALGFISTANAEVFFISK